ncbi:unnamed protein product [Rotaria sp. Silwood1]|nr:unnamed protein product [Rotaria sp. Silwood1]
MFTGLGTSTVYNWIAKEHWKQLRESKVNQYINSPEILMNALNLMLKELTEGKVKLADGTEVSILSRPGAVVQIADAISKLVKSIKSLSKDKDYLASIVFAVNLLSKYMNDNDEDSIYDDVFRDKLIKLLSGFQTHCIKIYSPKNFQ